MKIQQDKFVMNVEKYLKPYAKSQIENWKSSNKIVVYENEDQLHTFIEEAKDNKTSNKKMYFGIVSDKLAERVQNEFQIDIKNYNCTIRANEIRKILKSHGKIKQEINRGQQAITEMEFGCIPEIIGNPDEIATGGIYHDKPVLRFTKDAKTVVGVISRKHLDIYAQTMYLRQKNKSLATTPSDENTFSHTSETLSGTASNNSIAKKEKNTTEI